MAQNTKFVEGNVGQIYALRTVGENSSVLDFSVASTPSKRDANGEWQKGETVWTNITAWNKLAENIAETWKPGDRVFVRGREEMKAAYTNKNTNEEMPARLIMVADLAGHDNSLYPSTQSRPAKSGESTGGGSSRPAPAAKKPAQKAAPVNDAELLGATDEELDTELPF